MLNKVILMGRLTRDPEIRYKQSTEPMAIARYSLAVERRFKREGEQKADFIPCVAFGKQGEFAERYFRKGQLVSVAGRLQARNWDDNEGKKRVTTEVVVEEQYFAESKKDEEKTYNQSTRRTSAAESGSAQRSADSAVKEKNKAPEGFSPIDEDIEDLDLPF
jgi:single-strand DNA-binding protein